VRDVPSKPQKPVGRPRLDLTEKAKALTIKAHPQAVAGFKTHCAKSKQSHRQAFESLVKNINTK
jgi:hypothetical protein